MCTVSIVPLDGGFRLVCNRDERRDRPKAFAPRTVRCGDRTATFPIDPAGGGTWIGVNDLGLTAALLNRTGEATTGRSTASMSRGAIIPRLLACRSWLDAMLVAAALDPRSFEPFRLILVQGGSRVGECVNDGVLLSYEAAPLMGPRLFTSSSLGDGRVDGPRRELFRQLLLSDRVDWLRAQFRFHRHRWAHSPELSIEMERADAATVSRTAIDVGASVIRLSYEPLPTRVVSDAMVA
jgi:hypothetical protein